jgi:hypothetical protein
MLRNPLQHAMARASTAVRGRVFSVTTSRTSIRHHSFHHFSSPSTRLQCPAASFPRPASKPHFSSLRSAPSSTLAPSSSTPQSSPFSQIRHYAGQKDGLGQSETFREYRLRQEIEQRRRTLQGLEDEMLRTEIEVADARFHLNLQELARLPV